MRSVLRALAVAAAVLICARASAEVREERRWVASGVIGWNDLGGAGAMFTYRATPHFSADLAAGFSFFGTKIGIRGMAQLLRSSFTPVAGLGLMLGAGTNGSPLGLMNDDNTLITTRIGRSPFLIGVAGVEYAAPGGFTMRALAGWAQLVGGNVEILSGSPGPNLTRTLRLFFGSGLVIELSFGGAFSF